ncbi:helix-turn-helix domain-containing protein [Oceanibaculum nanhaiense]|uniref:helix-turn-helix domain-containing protein n=1 Tax=Oceanibaculum nanhaiense TaxID=1909734 RepID=UPI003F71401D
MKHDKRLLSRLFRERLSISLAERDMSVSALAARAGVDRSTVAQLLSAPDPRLPNGLVLANLASALGESADWLLGLSSQRGAVTDIVEQSVQVAEAARHPFDEQLRRWYREAAGYKVRHVPQTLPDLLKTPALLEVEYGRSLARSSDQAIADAAVQLDYIRQPDTDIEVAFAAHRLRDFADGAGIWGRMPPAERRRELEQMAQMARDLYPSLRVFLYDGRALYSAPFTVFGPGRAALYLGQRFLVFSSAVHIRLMIRHFDDLIRGAIVQAHDFADHVMREVARRDWD